MSYNFTLSFDFCPIYGAIKTQKVVNPMLAFSSWVWMSIVYGNQQASADADSMTLFSEYHLGRYIWLYMVIPLVASMLAAKLANKHLASVSDIMDMSGPQLLFSNIQEPKDREQNPKPSSEYYKEKNNSGLSKSAGLFNQV